MSAQREVPLEIPDSVQAVLAARIDRLDPADKNVLQIASVVGQPIRERLLCDVIGRSEGDIRDAVSRLQVREFLYQDPLLPDAEMRFRHALVREVAYRTLPKSQRKQVHALVVAALERSIARGSAEQLAFHALRGELWEKAADYCLRAADRSIDQSAFREASVFLRDAALSLNHLPQTREVVETSIDIRMRLRVAETGAPGDLAKLVRDLEDAAELAASIGDKERQARVMIHFGYVENMLGDNPWRSGWRSRHTIWRWRSKTTI